MSRPIVLGQQRAGGEGRRVIGIELRIAPDGMSAQEEVFMDGLDVVLPPHDFQNPIGLSWSVTIHTTNGDFTLDSRNMGQGINR